MGMDQLQELKMQGDAYARVALREDLMERHVRYLKVDDKEVEKRKAAMKLT